MADVFISYAREDLEPAKRLAVAIEERGWTVWWDRRLRAGCSYDEMIERELDQARCVVVMWTQHSVASEWVRNEAREGLERKILVPIRMEEVRIPLAFRHQHTAADFAECIEGIEAIIGAPPQLRLPPKLNVEEMLPPIRPMPTFEVVELETTEGTIAIELLHKEAPNHGRAFLELVRSGVLKGVGLGAVYRAGIQTDILPPMTGSEDVNDIAHERGIVLGPVGIFSNFFICRSSALAYHDYTAFGRVITGMDVVDRIGGNREMPVKITSATVRSRT